MITIHMYVHNTKVEQPPCFVYQALLTTSE